MTDVAFDSSTGLWTVSIEGSEVKHMGRVLICADGAPSKLATQLGIVKGDPQGVCSRAYIKGGTHRFKEDGMVFYVPTLLPGIEHSTHNSCLPKCSSHADVYTDNGTCTLIVAWNMSLAACYLIE